MYMRTILDIYCTPCFGILSNTTATFCSNVVSILNDPVSVGRKLLWITLIVYSSREHYGLKTWALPLSLSREFWPTLWVLVKDKSNMKSNNNPHWFCRKQIGPLLGLGLDKGTHALVGLNPQCLLMSTASLTKPNTNDASLTPPINLGHLTIPLPLPLPHPPLMPPPIQIDHTIYIVVLIKPSTKRWVACWWRGSSYMFASYKKWCDTT